MRRTRRRFAAASVALAVVAALVGCASIPSSGGVHAGGSQTSADALDLDRVASMPRAGADQEQILRGFIDAATDPRNNYYVARQFLAPGFADEWDAGAGATVDEAVDRTYQQTGEDQMVVQAIPTASLLPNGQYEPAASSAPIPLTYTFTQVEGEWRISAAPLGLLIDAFDFARVYRTHTLYFFDPGFRYAVPDVRWFAGRDAVQTSIVRALLDGPADWLAPGVESAFPEGSRLEADTVPIVAGVASVDVDAVADDTRSIQRMEAQLSLSLESVRSVQRVRLSLNGAVQDVPESASTPTVNPRVGSQPVAFDGERFGHVGDDGVVPIAGLSEQVAARAPLAAAVGPGDETAAVLTADGVWRVSADGEPEQLDPRDGLVTPVLDSLGVVWSTPAATPDQVVVYGPAGAAAEPVQVAVPWAGGRLIALQVSRDGTRVIALIADGVRARLVAAAVERNEDGIPVAVGPEVLQLADVTGTPLDAAWLDDRTVAVLSSTDAGTRLTTQVLGAPASSDPGPADGRTLVGGNAEREVRVLTAAGELSGRSGVGWQVQASGLRFLAAQQPD
ncbi:LpqB family beta-propeller domain-containing protein [Agromyces larvae]|uniref:LpqB family beta-propeller domain-containing protein n=1 Tax=Agromyces larvae TaxID=2929802 RepID=A0ABY4C0K4_9MICO|nr:LpqB family beta-propeller domain-containing protein [Agromyces larvae]UOE44534.1 LpqB family beta-propeller domain-containing protein [Agromyces larvae]